MKDSQADQKLRGVLTLQPLLDFWRNEMVPRCSYMAEMFASFEKQIRQNPAINGDITHPGVLDEYQDLMASLMSVAFPAAAWETEIAAALKPFSAQTFFSTPTFRRLLQDGNELSAGTIEDNISSDLGQQRLLRAYRLILDQLYDIPGGVDAPLVRVVSDTTTGLNRYFRITPDMTFMRVGTVGRATRISDADRRRIIDNIANVKVLGETLPLTHFIFKGFIIVRAVDVTEPNVILKLERDLIDQETIFSAEGFARLQNRLRTLFERPDITAGIGAVQGEQVLILNDGHSNSTNCLFRNSSHIPLADLQRSIWLRAIKKGSVLRINDLAAEPNLSSAERRVVEQGIRSVIIMPLLYQDAPLGTFTIKAPGIGAFGPMDEIRLKKIAPIFSMALKRGLDDMNNAVQAVIKEECTAVHPSLEWRFRQAAMAHMDRKRKGEPSEMEPIIFKEVVPLYGQADIKGSSEARIQAIQTDLTHQLKLAGEVLQTAQTERSWPLLQEYNYRINKRIDGMRNGLSAEAETTVSGFLKNELEPTFEDLLSVSPRVAQRVAAYRQALDPTLGVIYRKRKAFEQSVAMLNEQLSIYLDHCQLEAQKALPHYFEKHQTDGIDYMIYLGAAMQRSGHLPTFFLKNLGLWQLNVACGMARNTERIKPQLPVALDTCHLVLFNRSPLAIRFRYDEKRFDVDGAYDVRQEIIKSRLDKAVIKGGRQRLTQPGRIAVVYAHPKEGREIRQHIEFLQSGGQLLADVEYIDLEDLPGVRGLKAIRVKVNLEAASDEQEIFQATG